MSRYRNSLAVGRPDRRRLQGVDASRAMTSSPGDGLDAVDEVLGVERHGQLGALVLGVDAPRWPGRRPGSPTVSSSPSARMARRTGVVASRASSFTRRTASSSALAADDEPVGVARRDQLAVVRELALDQAGREPDGADLERGVALAQAQRDSPRRRQQPLQLGQRPRRHQHLLALAQDARARQVAHGQPVGVGGHEPQPALLGREQHAGEDRAGVVARLAARTTWRSASAEARRPERDGVAGGLPAAAGTPRPGAAAP